MQRIASAFAKCGNFSRIFPAPVCPTHLVHKQCLWRGEEFACWREQIPGTCYLYHPHFSSQCVFMGRGEFSSCHPSIFGVPPENRLGSLGIDSGPWAKAHLLAEVDKSKCSAGLKNWSLKSLDNFSEAAPNVCMLWGVQTASHYIPSIHSLDDVKIYWGNGSGSLL